MKAWGFACLLLGFITVLQSCAPTHEISPTERKQELLAQAQRIYKISVANARSARLSTTGSNARDIDVSLLFPDWDVNGIKQNSKSQDVLGVLLKNNAKEYWEVDFIFTDGKAQMIFKKYTLKDGCLTIYNRYGQFLEKGRYFAETKQYSRFITRASLTKQARVSSEDPEMVDRGELDIEVNVRPEEDHSNDGAPGEGGSDMGGDSGSGWSQGSDLSGNLFPVGPISTTVNIPINFNPTFVNPNEQTSKEIKNELNNPCYTSALNSLLSNESFMNNEEINKIMQNFDCAGSQKLSIKFDNLEDNKNGSSVDATIFASSADFTAFNIGLNDLALKNASQEYVAGTIAHEVLHAYITSNRKSSDKLDVMDHEEMSTNYVKPLASMLNKLYLMPMEDAIALAWGGLSGTKAWKEMIAKDNQNNTGETGKIDEINKRYKNLNNAYGDQAKGTKCK